MQTLNFQPFEPNLPSLDQFQNKLLKIKQRQKQIDQISAFNNKNQIIKHKNKSLNDGFEEKDWNISEENDDKKQEDFFQVQGKHLLSSQKSQKHIKTHLILLDIFFHALLFAYKFWYQTLIWTSILDSALIVFGGSYLSLKFKLFTNKLSIEQIYRVKYLFHFSYGFILISSLLSIVTQSLFIYYQIYENNTIKLSTFLQSLTFIVLLFIQLKLIKENRYIMWIQGQINKKQINQFQLTDSLDTN